MKAVDVETLRMMAHYVDQLNKLGFYDTEGMNYEELKLKLTIKRMKQIDITSPKNEYF